MHGMGCDGLGALSDLARLPVELLTPHCLFPCMLLWLLTGDIPVLARPARCHVSWVDL